MIFIKEKEAGNLSLFIRGRIVQILRHIYIIFAYTRYRKKS